MFSGDRSHSVRPRMRPSLTPLTLLTMEIHPHDVTVVQLVKDCMACCPA